MNKSMNYPVFTLNNESVILRPGSQFSKIQLVSRLHEMGIDASGVKSKNDLINLYESALSNNQNKIRIFNRLKTDTQNFNSNLGVSQRQSIPPPNMSNFSMTNNAQNKMVNISHDNTNPLNQNNSGKKEINIIRQSNQSNTNMGANFNNTNNTFKNINQEQVNDNYKIGYSDNQLRQNNFENNSFSRNFQYYNQNNNQTFLNNNRSPTNINQSNQNNNNSNYRNYQNNIQNINKSDYNNKYNESYNPYSSNNSQNSYSNNNINSQINNFTKYNNSQYQYKIEDNSKGPLKPKNQEEINTDIKTNNIQTFSFKNESYNDDNPKIFTNVPNTTPISPENTNIITKNTNNSNLNNNYYMNNNNYIQRSQNQNRNQQDMILENQGQSKLSTIQEQITNNNGKPYQREPDEESTFSMFSAFKDFKNSPFYKNHKTICFNILLSLLVILLAIGVLCFIKNCWDSISSFFCGLLDVLTDPQRIFEAIGGFFSTLIFGSVRYFYITIPLIGLIIFMIWYGRKYYIEKRCREILEKMKNYLINNQNNPNNILFEEDIYNKFVKEEYGISFKKFKRTYLKVMKRIRSHELSNFRLKLYSQIFDGKEKEYWGLNY